MYLKLRDLVCINFMQMFPEKWWEDPFYLPVNSDENDDC